MSSVIEAGKGVILRKGKNLKYVCVSDKKVEKMEKFLFSSKDMIGKPYGTAFKVIDKKSLEVIDPVLVEEHAEEYENRACKCVIFIFSFVFGPVIYIPGPFPLFLKVTLSPSPKCEPFFKNLNKKFNTSINASKNTKLKFFFIQTRPRLFKYCYC